MELFVYRWDYINGLIYGSLPGGRYLEISGFIPWAYKHGGSIKMKKLMGSETVYVSKVPSMHPDVIIQFLTVSDLQQVGWVAIDKVADGRCIRCRYTDIKPSPRIDVPDLHIVSFDIEAYSMDRSFPNPTKKEDKIICISTVDNRGETRTFSGDENSFIGDFMSYILAADVLVGYNVHGFDWNYILERHDIAHSSKYPGIAPEIVAKEWSSSAVQNIKLRYLSIPGILSLDLYYYLARSFKIDDYRLDTVAEYFGAGSKLDMPVWKMWDDYEKGEISEIIQYCEQDCRLVLDVVEKSGMIGDVLALAKVTYTHAELLFTMGQQIRIRSMLRRECIKYGYVDDSKYSESEPYQGAHVIEPVPGVYDNCACMDFASLYPSIIIAENICYTTFQNGEFNKNIFGLIPNLVHRLIDERNNIRHDPAQKAYANALKVCANSIYGVFGARGQLCLMPAAIRITRIGRESLNKAVNYLNDNGYKVIYGDTDSCIYSPIDGNKMSDEQHAEVAANVSALFPQPIQMKFEGTFKRFLVLGKKMYITMDYEDQIKYKGVLPARRDNCKFVVNTYKEIVEMVMKDRKFRDKIRDIIRHVDTISSDMFTMKKTYNGPYRILNYPLEVYNRAYGPLKKGETVFVFVSNGKTLGERMRPLSSSDPIDYMWYLQRLVKPIDLIMAASGKVFRMKHNIELYDPEASNN